MKQSIEIGGIMYPSRVQAAKHLINDEGMDSKAVAEMVGVH